MDRRIMKAALFSHIKISSADECWVWTGPKNPRYGRLSLGGKQWLVHRLSYRIYNGEIPPKFIVHHDACRTRLCVNPSHLIAITQTENVKIAARRGCYKGERNRNNKLTEGQVISVKILREIKGLTQKCISEVTGIHRSTISDIIRGRCWSHVIL